MHPIHARKPVEFLDGGVWHRGQLWGWRQLDGAWSAYVRWHVGGRAATPRLGAN
jgi:hypothetical protein